MVWTGPQAWDHPPGAEGIPCCISKDKQPPLEVRGSLPRSCPRDRLGHGARAALLRFLELSCLSNTSGLFPAALYPELYSLPCPWMLLSFAPCPWTTLFSSMSHTPAVLTLGPRARHFPDPWAPSAWTGSQTSGHHLSSDEGKEWGSDQTTLDNDRSPRARMSEFNSGTSMDT